MKKNKCFKNIFLFSLIFTILSFNCSINAFANHEHTSNCYPGTQHICKGDETNGGSCFMKAILHVHNNDCYSLECVASNVESTYTANENGEICSICQQPVGTVKIVCPDCNVENSSYGCHNRNCSEYVNEPTIQHTYMTLEKAKEHNNIMCGKTDTTVDKWEKTCGFKNNAWYNTNGIEVTPSCSFIVKNIKPIYDEQKLVEIDSGIDMTIEVEFLDGHKELKVGDFNDFNKSFGSAESKIVNLYWTGIGDAYGNQKQFSCKLTCFAPEPTSTPTPTPTPTQTPTPTTIPTPTPTKEPTPTMEIQTEKITPIVNIEEDKNLEESFEIDKELVLGEDNDISLDEEEDTSTPTIIELEETAAEKAERFKKAFILIIIIIVVIIAFVSLNIYVAKKELEEELDYDEDEDEDEDDDYYDE